VAFQKTQTRNTENTSMPRTLAS